MKKVLLQRRNSKNSKLKLCTLMTDKTRSSGQDESSKKRGEKSLSLHTFHFVLSMVFLSSLFYFYKERSSAVSFCLKAKTRKQQEVDEKMKRWINSSFVSWTFKMKFQRRIFLNIVRIMFCVSRSNIEGWIYTTAVVSEQSNKRTKKKQKTAPESQIKHSCIGVDPASYERTVSYSWVINA